MSDQKGAAPFRRRHLGPGPEQTRTMLETLGLTSLDQLIDGAVPMSIRLAGTLDLPAALSEADALEQLAQLAGHNDVYRSYIGMGYSDTLMPGVIQRNILESPGWYTAYTPYQAEIAQGRLEALLNFQTTIVDLTGMEIANASLLDEATAAAEAMALCHAALRGKRNRFVVSPACHPQTIAVISTRARPLDIEVVVVDPASDSAIDADTFGVVVQYPQSDGRVTDLSSVVDRAHREGALVIAAADLLSLTLLAPPGEWGADVVVGSSQRFGLPMGYGGPHAAYFATSEAYKRLVPGRVVGVSKDRDGRAALRLALQTREQHIRRDKATSNICTAQVLPAVLASMYAVYHGPDGLRSIAQQIHQNTADLAATLRNAGVVLEHDTFFDTLRVRVGSADEEASVLERARQSGMNLRGFGDGSVGISLDETTSRNDLAELAQLFCDAAEVVAGSPRAIPETLVRKSAYLEHPVFHSYRSETELLRYLHRLEAKDLSLTTSMIPLGSCTMKLNATSEMVPVTWPGFCKLHPYAPAEQTRGYATLCRQLEEWLAEITGFAGISLQPNAGSQGEYAGLLAIRRYHEDRGEERRNVCLIPTSAHGTNPASAVMAGMKVIAVACDEHGNIDVDDLTRKAEQNHATLAALMVTYPSTHGVFEESIRDICEVVHRNGGQVYMDGANMNAQVGLCRPGDIGADVCHLNLHKTFCIPHGGGGPGMGPIGVAAHLVAYLPAHPLAERGETMGAISAAPVGSGTILPISWAYIAMMGPDGLTDASRIAILNANYMAKRLAGHFPVLYQGKNGFVAHECILDLRPLKHAGIEVEDVAKRLMDYGFHAPTVSWPVAGTIMIEPTESEPKDELDRFCDALISIKKEVEAIERREIAAESSPLKNAPHTAESLIDDSWNRPYSRQQAAYPAPWTHEHKYWPPVARIDNAWGDRHLFCSCAGLELVEEEG